MATPVQDSLHILQTAQKEINKLLSGPEHISNLLEINANFRRIATRLQYIGAVLEQPAGAKKTTKEKFPPITNFMGEEIKIEKPVTKNDLNPNEAEKKKYLDKVEKLWKEINGMSVEQVLNSYTATEDIIVVRGVAKRAKVDGWDKRPMDNDFISDIMMAVEIKDEEDEKLKTVKSTSQNGLTTVLTQADIDADPELKKLKAQPGDSVVLENGKKQIKKALTT